MNDFEEYIRQGEPLKREKGYAWQTAIGLQAVDDLKPSEYLIQTARLHIEGDITIEEAKQLIDSYYQSRTIRTDIEDRTEEADKVSARIAEILSEKTFTFSPVEYITIHRRLFQGIYKFAGRVRDYNITKKEWVLKGETVLYASADSIRETLDYDFMQEKNFSYKDLNINDAITHIAKFISGVWQIHAFGEGNTRTTAVFTIKYLRTFGFDISNEAFANHSWYFRNALVRANYNNLSKGIYATTEYIEAFFRNLILSEHNELKNRTMLVQESSSQNIQSASTSNDAVSKCNICTLNCTLEEIAVLNFLREQPKATQKEIAAHIGKSERTVKTITVNLTEKGIIERKNGKRNGFWEIKTNDLNS
ncbi:Fic family protein [Alistipes putredinis]|uniref:Fic family protein n=1 Tax=Alistipes putredinis TaxID=28117 RepID=UPI0039841718